MNTPKENGTRYKFEKTMKTYEESFSIEHNMANATEQALYMIRELLNSETYSDVSDFEEAFEYVGSKYEILSEHRMQVQNRRAELLGEFGKAMRD